VLRVNRAGKEGGKEGAGQTFRVLAFVIDFQEDWNNSTCVNASDPIKRPCSFRPSWFFKICATSFWQANKKKK